MRAPGQRPAASWGAVLVLATYLLVAPPAFVLGPLAGLLFLSGPRTLREWWWAIGGALICGLWFAQAGDLAEQVVRAAAALVTGAFLALFLTRPGPFLRTAGGALGLAAAGLAIWCLIVGIGWNQVEQAIARQGWAAYRELLTTLRQRAVADPASVPEGAVSMLEAMSEQVGAAAAFYPAFLTLTGLAGLAIGWRWYHRLASRPQGPVPGPFAAFRFNDHMVWGVIAGLALVVAPLPEWAGLVGANLLIVWCALYAVRGAAVVRSAAAAVPPVVVVTAAFAALFMLPFVVSGLVMFGLADTWLDFRRRFVAPPSGGPAT